ncbi:MAG: hypothetical protein AAGF11_45720 [Myxococcota bacterium]
MEALGATECRGYPRVVGWVEMSRGVSIGLVLVACDPTVANDGEACGKADVDVSGMLVGADEIQCDPCPRDTSSVWLTLETTCEPGVEWRSPSICLIDSLRVTNLATRKESTIDITACSLASMLWTVVPGQPMEASGPSVVELIDEPGEYAFVAELNYELDSAEFEGIVQ